MPKTKLKHLNFLFYFILFIYHTNHKWQIVTNTMIKCIITCTLNPTEFAVFEYNSHIHPNSSSGWVQCGRITEVGLYVVTKKNWCNAVQINTLGVVTCITGINMLEYLFMGGGGCSINWRIGHSLEKRNRSQFYNIEMCVILLSNKLFLFFKEKCIMTN